MADDFESSLISFESGGRNIENKDKTTSSGRAGGYYQITPGTWNDFAPRAGVDLSQYPTQMGAPPEVQKKVASVIPMGRWAPETLSFLQKKGFKVDPKATYGQNLAMNGGNVAAPPPVTGFKPAAPATGTYNQAGQPTGPLAAPTATAVADDRPWWQKAASDFVMPGTDPKTGLQTDSPMAKMVERYNKAPEEMRAKEADQAPSQEMANQLARSPGARNVGPMGGVQLSSVPQTYGQTINSLGAPLTWNNLPPQAPQGLRAGYQAAVPGMSLNSFQGPPMASLDPYGLGYGSIGYGFG